MSTFIVTKIKDWEAKYPNVKKHVPKGKPTPYPYEQESAHFLWFSPAWTLCHGFVHGRPHAWVEIHDNVIIDFAMAGDPLIRKSHIQHILNVTAALLKTKGGGSKQSVWEKKLEKFNHNKTVFYKKFKPAKVRKFSRNEMFQMLDHYGRYGKWEGDPSPFAGVI